jgi:surface polysaccharide O-acyltransferase-like enzyme
MVVKSHDTDTDIMRLLSAFAVVLIHVSDFSSHYNIFLNCAAHFCVPVFIMISGYYILPRNHKISDIYRRILKLFARLLLWSAFYLIADILIFNGEKPNLGGCLQYLLTEPGPMWYQYAIITLLIFTPILHVFYENADKTTYKYALGVTFLFGSVILILMRMDKYPLLTTIVVDKMKVPYTLGFVFLYLFGGYIHRFGIERPKIWFILWAVSLAVTYFWSCRVPSWSSPSISFFAPNTITMGAAVFICCKYICSKHPIRNNGVIKSLYFGSRQTEGTYYLHMFYINLIGDRVSNGLVNFPTFLIIPIKAITIFAITFLTVAIMQKIPFVNWMVGGKVQRKEKSI